MTFTPRKRSAQSVASKIRQLSVEYAECQIAQEQAEDDLLIAEIVKELRDNPKKIRGAHKAVMGVQFLPAAEFEENFDENCVFMFKLPKSWVEGFLRKYTNKFPKESQAAMNKADCCWAHKVFYRSCIVDRSSFIFDHNIANFEAEMDKRYEKVGRALATVVISRNVIDFAAWGSFTLEPKAPAGNLAHVYTSIVFNNIISVSLENCSAKITTAWTISENWSIKTATLRAPANDPLRSTVLCRTIFEKDATFKQWFSTYKFKSGDDAGEDADAPGEGATEDAAPTSQASSSSTKSPAKCKTSCVSNSSPDKELTLR